MTFTIFRRDEYEPWQRPEHGGMLMPPMRKVATLEDLPEDLEKFIRKEFGKGYYYVNEYRGRDNIEVIFKGEID